METERLGGPAVRITKFRVQIDAAGEELVGAKIILPHHDGIAYSSTWSEAEVWQWIKSTVKEYLQAQARAAKRVARARP